MKNILKEAYGDSSQVTDELVEAILTPGLRDGAAEVFLDFICGGGRFPKSSCPSARCPCACFGGRRIRGKASTRDENYTRRTRINSFRFRASGTVRKTRRAGFVRAALAPFVDDYAATAKTRDL